MDLLRWFRENQPNADVARVETEGMHLRVYCARPGILIGKQGATVIAIKEALEKLLGAIHLEIREIRTPEAEPLLVATSVLRMIDRGIAIDKALEKSVKNAARFAKAGCRIRISGAKGEHSRASDDFSEGGAVYATEEMSGTVCEVWICRPTGGAL